MISFETKCMRCEKLITVDFEKNFGEVNTKDLLEKAKKFVAQNPRMINMCPHCLKKTYQLVVSPVVGDVNYIIKPSTKLN